MSDQQKRKRPHLGHAITRDGKIRYTSVSQIKMFSPTVDGGCPRKWAYAYRFGIKLARTDALEEGVDYAEKLEHYLTTGEDVLPPVLQPAKKLFPTPGEDLECEQPLGDMENALKMRDALLHGTFPVSYTPTLQKEIERFAGLTFAGIPVDGAADCRHARGEYIDSDGILKKDPAGTLVIHIDDLKTTSRIFPHKVLKGPNAGSIIPSYCKTDAEVCEDVQMLGYARHAINKYPGMTHARPGLIYANKNKREAVKRTGLISVEQILERTRPIDNIVGQMLEVATAQRIEDVEPNVHACDSYTHVDPQDPTKTLKGCGYRYQCPIQVSQFVSTMLGTHKESSMSLCDSVSGSSAPAVVAAPSAAPAMPPLDAAAHEAAVAAEKAKLLATMTAIPLPIAPTPPPVVAGPTEHEMAFARAFAAATAGTLKIADASGNNVYDKQGADSGWIYRAGTPAELAAIKAVGGPGAAPPVPVAPAAPVVVTPTPPPLPISVNPPDQPRQQTMLDAADPPPAEEIAQITDPTLRAQVEQHAREHAARAAAEAARIEAEKVAAGTSSWCVGSNGKLVVNSTMSVEGHTCSCGRHWTLKKLGPEKEGDNYVVTVPRHKPKKEEAAAAASAPEPVVPAPTASSTIEPPPPPPVVQHEWLKPAAGGFAEGQIQTMNGNGHHNGHTVAPAVKQAFFVETEAGTKFAIVAETMQVAMQMVMSRIEGNIKTINKLDGYLI